jgi:thioesterase domain-containing protein
LIELFKTHTIQSLAKYIKKAQTETTSTTAATGIITPQDDNLVLLKPAKDNAQNLFFVHDGTGEVEGYIEFCKHLSDEFQCWGLRAHRLENLTPQNWTIEELSQQYIRRIKKIQTRGPYFIAGWSLGGTIAFEMTKQLEQQKEKIALLALVDSPPPQSSTRKTISPFNLESELKIVKAYAPNSEIEDKLKNVTRLTRFWLSVVKYLDAGHYDIEPIKKAITRYGIHTLPNYHQLDTRESIYYLNIGRTLHQARAGYIPTGKVSAAIHFFKACESRFEHQPWNNYCQNPMTLHEIDGNHFSLFQLPRVIPFARTFTRIIKKLSLKI